MADKNLHDTIEKYLLGELIPSEREQLEADIAIDAKLFKQVEIQRLALLGIRRLAAADMYGNFDKWDKEIDTPSSPSPPAETKTTGKVWIWASTTLLLLLLAGAIWHFGEIKKIKNTQQQENQEIARRDSIIMALRAEFQQKEEELSDLLKRTELGKDSTLNAEIKRLREELDQKDKAMRALESRNTQGSRQFAMQLAQKSNMSTRGDIGSDDPTLAAANKAYNNSKFEEAIRLLNSIPKNDPRQAQVVQLMPYALFYAQRFQQAIPVFINLWEQDPDFEAMNAQGYLLLCYIAEGKSLEARQMRLTILQNPKHKYYKWANEATSILKSK